MSRFAYPSPPSSAGADSRTLKSGTGTPQNSSPASILTRGSPGTMDSTKFPGFLKPKPPSPKFSLFPAPDCPSEVVEASLPTLIAARALANAKSVPNFKARSETTTRFDTANLNCPMPRTVSNPETGIKKAMNKLSQRAEYKRDRGLSFKETLKRLLSKKSSASLKKSPPESGKQYVEMIESGNSLGSTSSSYIEDGKPANGDPNTPDIPEEDELRDLAHTKIQQKIQQKVIRRVRSEADFSPKVSKINFTSPGNIGLPPVELPPTPEISPYHESQVFASDFKSFPARGDSLQYALANKDQTSDSQANIQLPNDDSLINLPQISTGSCEESHFLGTGLTTCVQEDDSSSNGDPFYLEAQLAALEAENGRAEAYSPFDDQFGVYPEVNWAQYPYPESLAEVQLSDPFYSPAATSSSYHSSSRHCGKGNMSYRQSRTSQTGSPSPRSPDPENVPRGILDTFIESLIRNGHGNTGGRRGGLQIPICHSEDEPEYQLASVRQTLARAIEEGEVLDLPTTMALADFVLGSLDAFTYDKWQKAEKVKRQRQLLKAQKERLDRAIEIAMDADTMLKEEETGLEEDQEGVVRSSLQLTEIMDGEGCSL